MKSKDPIILRNRKRCLMAMISATVVSLCVFSGGIMNLVSVYDENFSHVRKGTFSLFTVNSNILVAISMLLCMPYTIDGLRTGNYHLPNWVVDLMYVAVTTVALTFLNSLTVLAPRMGFPACGRAASRFWRVSDAPFTPARFESHPSFIEKGRPRFQAGSSLLANNPDFDTVTPSQKSGQPHAKTGSLSKSTRVRLFFVVYLFLYRTFTSICLFPVCVVRKVTTSDLSFWELCYLRYYINPARRLPDSMILSVTICFWARAALKKQPSDKSLFARDFCLKR